MAYLYYRINSRRGNGTKIGLQVAKTVSRKCIYNKVTDQKLKQLGMKQIKRRSLAKIQWGMCAFQEWREHKLQDFINYDPIIFETNLDDLGSLNQAKLSHSLCKFLPEVTKVKDRATYPGATLYQMVIAIQRHLNEKGLNWKLIDGFQFSNVKIVLDNIMKERPYDNLRMVKRQAEVISYKFENKFGRRTFLARTHQTNCVILYYFSLV